MSKSVVIVLSKATESKPYQGKSQNQWKAYRIILSAYPFFRQFQPFLIYHFKGTFHLSSFLWFHPLKRWKYFVLNKRERKGGNQIVPKSFLMLTAQIVFLGESEVIKRIKEIVKKNKIWRSFIGMGYYNTKTPHTILRNMFENPGWCVTRDRQNY